MTPTPPITPFEQADRAVEQTFLAILRERHPGVRWQLVRADRPVPDAAAPAGGEREER